MSPLLIEFLGVLARWVITSLGAYLVAKHVINSDQEAHFADGAVAYVAAHLTIWAPLAAGLLWGLSAKYRARLKFIAAMDSSRFATEATVNEAAKSPGIKAQAFSKAVGVLLVCALGAGVLTMPACASTQPPAGTYSPVGTKAYNADQLMKDLQALGQTARNLNAVSGAEHLSDRDTVYVRDFSLIAGAGLYAYGQGSTTLATAKEALDALPPGYLPAAYLVPAKAAFDKAVADHGAGASALYVVVDIYKVLRQNVSVSATKNPKLTLVLGAVDAGIAAIPLQ